MMIENINLTDELILKAGACKTHEELLALAHENGITITEEQLPKLMAEVTKKCSGELSDDVLEMAGAVGGLWDPFHNKDIWDPYRKKTVKPTGMCYHYSCRECGTIFCEGSGGLFLYHLSGCKNSLTSCCRDCRHVVSYGEELICNRL